MKRAELGIHSNSAFARLLTDHTMVTIETVAEPGSPRWRVAARRAAMVAYQKLQAQLPDQSFSFYFAPSHPNYRAPDATMPEAEPPPVNDTVLQALGSATDLSAEDASPVTSKQAA